MKVEKAADNRVCDSDTLPSSSDTQQNIEVANSYATNDSGCKLRMYMDNRRD